MGSLKRLAHLVALLIARTVRSTRRIPVYDDPWWRRELGRPAPWLAGAGSGLRLLPGPAGCVSEPGFTIKRSD
jgi:hypothetical protein